MTRGPGRTVVAGRSAVTLTPLGHRTIETAVTALLTHEEELVARLDPGAVRGFGAVLAALTEAVT